MSTKDSRPEESGDLDAGEFVIEVWAPKNDDASDADAGEEVCVHRVQADAPEIWEQLHELIMGAPLVRHEPLSDPILGEVTYLPLKRYWEFEAPSEVSYPISGTIYPANYQEPFSETELASVRTTIAGFVAGERELRSQLACDFFDRTSATFHSEGGARQPSVDDFASDFKFAIAFLDGRCDRAHVEVSAPRYLGEFVITFFIDANGHAIDEPGLVL